MRRRYLVVAAGLAAALLCARGLFWSDTREPKREGVVRIAAPVAAPAPAASAPIAAPLAAPAPTPTAEPGIDPPPPLQEKNSPDYAKLGVQPAI